MRKILPMLLAISVVFGLFASVSADAASNVKICGVDIGIAANTYMQFTTKDGTKSDSGYYYKDYYLGASQCFGFARWCQYKLFGTTSLGNCDTTYKENSSKDFYRVSANGKTSIAAGSLTTTNLKAMINEAKPGAHIRTNGTAHSLVITEITDKGFSIAQCNGSNNDEYSGWKQNYVGTYTYTWSSYVSSTYGLRGINYIEMPYKYPYDKTPVITSAKGDNHTEITVKWSKVTDATKYKVLRRKSGTGNEYVTAKSSTTDTSFTDTGLEKNQRYYYKVVAYNGSTELGTSDAVGAYTKFDPPVIKAESTSKLSLSWDTVSYAESYTVRRRVEDGEYDDVKTVTGTTFTDSGLNAGTRYYYWIQANCVVNEEEIIAKSTSSSQYTLPITPVINSTERINQSQIKVNWSSVASANSYTLSRRKAGDSAYTNITTTSETSYTDSGLEAGTIYWYILTANNNGGTSANSVAVRGLTSCNAPVVSTVDESSLKISWNKVVGLEWNEHKYQIFRKLPSDFDFTGKQIAEVTGQSTYTDVGLSPEQNYQYKVVVVDNTNNKLTDSAVGEGKTAKEKDIIAPIISNVNITDISGEKFTFNCKLTDNVAIKRVWVAICDSNGNWYQYGLSATNGDFSHTVYTKDLAGEGKYNMHLYAYDEENNETKVEVNDINAFNLYYLDINGFVDGQEMADLTGCVTFDLYVDGTMIGDDISDHCQLYSFGSKYEITDIKPTSGYIYKGISDNSKRLIGTVESLNVIELVFEKEKILDYTINTLNGVVVDGSFYAEAEISKNTDRDAVDTIVIAVYKDEVLIDRIYMKSKFMKDQSVVFGGYLAGVEGAMLKAFVWDNMTSMNTLSNVIEK